ncbi:hypothetical protein P1X14_13255 [Sphingomonas sp. AOB5]|uniref:hypothetical protein n=1 Tax=Sphingomonas sp. AOB5 TaxID=3034017 RepID=UPI0023F77C6C|nr:hypothetical protein [Sphingomonas sp. AOB5]MDF7776220.1 hypothetical protein [Sphingomonas sp. AOB5]
MQRVSGNILANLLSGGAWLLTHGVYGILRVIYRRDVKWMALFAGIVVALVLLIKWVL